MFSFWRDSKIMIFLSDFLAMLQETFLVIFKYCEWAALVIFYQIHSEFSFYATQTLFPGLSYLINLRSSFLRKESCDREMFTLGQIMNIQGHKIDKNLSYCFWWKEHLSDSCQVRSKLGKITPKSIAVRLEKNWRSYRQIRKLSKMFFFVYFCAKCWVTQFNWEK